MRLSRFLPAVVALAAFAATPVASVLAGAEPVTTCGQAVAKRGVLTGDLDCSAFNGTAVSLGKTGKLDLAGFTLTAKDIAVHCDVGTCEIRGPGTIRRLTYDPTLNFLEEGIGIQAYRKARVRDVTLQNWNRGVFALDGAVVRSCTIQDGGWGVVAGPVKVVDSTITGHALAGVRAYEGTKDGVHYLFYACHVKGSTFSGNGVDIESYRQPVVRGTSCTTSDHLTIPNTPYGGGDEWGVCGP
jgi:hypothetical protein